MSNMKNIFGVFMVLAFVFAGTVSAQEDTATMEEYIKSFATPEEAMQALQSEGVGESPDDGGGMVEGILQDYEEVDNAAVPTMENSIEEMNAPQEQVVEEKVETPVPVEENQNSLDIFLMTTILLGILVAVLVFVLYKVSITKGKSADIGVVNKTTDSGQVNI